MLVTCYYDIYNKPDRFQYYLDLFLPLANSGLSIALFVDPATVSQLPAFPPTVEVIGYYLAECELYSMAMKYDRELPSIRTHEKDTKEFFGLMNTKVEFVKIARDLFPDVHTFQWIDYGIMKIVKNPERFLNTLKKIQEKRFEKLTIPGCWSMSRPFSVDSISWRFCGGHFIIPSDYIDCFYGHVRHVLNDFCTLPMYKLTWETNVWTVIEMCAERENMVWYFADHNDTIVTNCPL